MNHLLELATKEKWEKVRVSPVFKKYREELISLWKEYCEGKEIVALPYSKYKEFFFSGDRDGYEKYYFSHRHILSCSSLLALIYPEESKYLEKLQDVIFAICDEYSWCLPAHQKEWETPDDNCLDLFASETAFALSEIYTMLGDRLDNLVKTRLYQTLKHRVLDSMESRTFIWDKMTNNWSAVCGGSVASTMMLMFPEEFPKYQARFDTIMEHFFSGFSKDGVCLEGCGYWLYGFGFFTVYADYLKAFTNGERDYFQDERVKTIATFLQKMYLSGSTCVSFADGGRKLSFHLGIQHYLKSVYPDEVVSYSPEYSYNYDHCARYCLHLRSALWVNEDYFNNPDENPENFSYYSPFAKWYIKKNKTYGFAAKGGFNEEPHNNNDIGTFIFAKNGNQLLSDLGPGKYTRQYFGHERYTIFEASSRGHNVPIVGGEYQHVGVQYFSKNEKAGEDFFELDIEGAYPIPELKKLTRRFETDSTGVTIQDTFETTISDITERFISIFEPIVGDGYVQILDGKLYFDQKVLTPKIQIADSTRNDTVVYTIDFELPKNTKNITFRVE